MASFWYLLDADHDSQVQLRVGNGNGDSAKAADKQHKDQDGSRKAAGKKERHLIVSKQQCFQIGEVAQGPPAGAAQAVQGGRSP